MSTLELSQSLIKHYNISKIIDVKKGGQKVVFIVVINDIFYALKVIGFADERILREIKIYEKYKAHTGIPKVFKVEQFENDTIILEEYIEGNVLSTILNEYANNPTKTINLIKELANILKPFWSDRFIHRDIKPNNIIVKPNGNPVLLDFGIARALDESSLTATGNQPMTPIYASPEQYLGKKDLISYRTDFFCLGILAYQMFTQYLPFGNTREEIEKTFLSQKWSFDLSNNILNAFCNSVLKFNPSERQRNFESFIKLLEQ